MKTISEKADQLIRNYAFSSGITGFIPVPIIDFLGLLGTQRVMLWRLSKLYGIPFSQNLARALLTTLMTSVASVVGSPIVGSMLKAIPGIGTIVGGSSMAALGGAATYAVGKVFQKHFENGGNLENFDPDKAKQEFAEKLKEGQELARSGTSHKS